MAGIFGGSREDRHFEKKVMDHLNDEHHPRCMLHESHEEEWKMDENDDQFIPECTCDEQREEDILDSILSHRED